MTDLSLAACLQRHRRGGGTVALAVVATVDSTNYLARRIARPYLDNNAPVPRIALVAREQTAGRGRRGRVWASPAGQGIYTSLLFSVTDPEQLSMLPLRVPLALCQLLDRVGVGCEIKWPNDLLFEGGKLAGVLIESLSGGHAVIVGYGINGTQTQSSLPAAGATSLRLATGSTPDLSALAVDLATALGDRLAGSEPLAPLVEAYRARSVHRPGDSLYCRLGGEVVRGAFAGFDDLGRLRLDTGDEELVLGASELISQVSAAAVNEEVAPAR